jgi:peroxisomal membrane protein 4
MQSKEAPVVAPAQKDVIKYKCSFWLSVLRGLRNGLYYGGQIRFIHGLVMLILFRKGGWIEGIKNVLKNTWEHARNLGTYVCLEKFCTNLCEKLTGKKKRYLIFICCFFCGLIAFRDNTPVNNQVTLYLISRILVGGIGNLAKKYNFKVDFETHNYLAAICWGVIMMLYEKVPMAIQPTLKSSMDFLYRDSESFISWEDFVPVAIPDKIVNMINKLF